jgi:hypothetical protein
VEQKLVVFSDDCGDAAVKSLIDQMVRPACRVYVRHAKPFGGFLSWFISDGYCTSRNVYFLLHLAFQHLHVRITLATRIIR